MIPASPSDGAEYVKLKVEPPDEYFGIGRPMGSERRELRVRCARHQSEGSGEGAQVVEVAAGDLVDGGGTVGAWIHTYAGWGHGVGPA